MAWILLMLYVLAASALAIGVYNYVSIQELSKLTKYQLQNMRRIDGKLTNAEKILNNKKWTWK